MALVKIAFLLLALVGAASAQVRAAGSKVNICVSIGNNVHSTLTVLSTELSNYPGHVRGACSRVCSTVCKDMLREVNAAGQCICKGSALKCGANAKPSNDKKSCKCLIGFKGNPLKGCVDINECAAATAATAIKSPCPENNECVNTAGSFECKACGKNAEFVNGTCQCRAKHSGDAYISCCADEDQYFYANRCYCNTGEGYEDEESGALVCLPHCGTNAHRWYPTPNHECQCDDQSWEGDPNVACCPVNSVYTSNGCVCERDFHESWGANGMECLPFCGLNAFRDLQSALGHYDCQCYYEDYVGDPTIACCPANAHANDGDTDCTCNEGYTRMWKKLNDGGSMCVKKCGANASRVSPFAACQCNEPGWIGDPNVSCCPENTTFDGHGCVVID